MRRIIGHTGEHRSGTWLAASMAALFLTAQLATIVHTIYVQHTTCVEHQLIVHVEADSLPSPSPELFVAYVASAGVPSDNHDNEGCASLLHSRERLLPFLDGPSRVAPDALRSSSPPLVPCWRSSVAVHRVAPKQSPPPASV